MTRSSVWSCICSRPRGGHRQGRSASPVSALCPDRGRQEPAGPGHRPGPVHRSAAGTSAWWRHQGGGERAHSGWQHLFGAESRQWPGVTVAVVRTDYPRLASANLLLVSLLLYYTAERAGRWLYLHFCVPSKGGSATQPLSDQAGSWPDRCCRKPGRASRLWLRLGPRRAGLRIVIWHRHHCIVPAALRAHGHSRPFPRARRRCIHWQLEPVANTRHARRSGWHSGRCSCCIIRRFASPVAVITIACIGPTNPSARHSAQHTQQPRRRQGREHAINLA